MNIGLLIGLTRLRVALLVAGLAWFVGLAPSFPARLAIGALVLVALVFDGLLDEQRISRNTKTPTHDRYQPAA
ncbi:hypothetical protein [Streptomyces sp. NPDC002402]